MCNVLYIMHSRTYNLLWKMNEEKKWKQQSKKEKTKDINCPMRKVEEKQVMPNAKSKNTFITRKTFYFWINCYISYLYNIKLFYALKLFDWFMDNNFQKSHVPTLTWGIFFYYKFIILISFMNDCRR